MAGRPLRPGRDDRHAGRRGPVPIRDVGRSGRSRDRAVGLGARLRARADGVERILRDGNGAARQIETFAATGDTRAVTRDIADATREVGAGAGCA